MNQNLTDINILLDRSGSMSDLAPEVRRNLKEYISTQRACKEGDANLTFAQFDSSSWGPDGQSELDFLIEGSRLNPHVPIENVMDGYEPRGCTPLIECMTKFISQAEARINKIPEKDRPARMLVVVYTDGYENASHQEFTRENLRKTVSRLQDAGNWEFIFLGANIDSFGESQSLGINPAMTANWSYTSAGISGVSCALNAASVSYRGGGSAAMNYNEDDLDVDPNLIEPTFDKGGVVQSTTTGK